MHTSIIIIFKAESGAELSGPLAEDQSLVLSTHMVVHSDLNSVLGDPMPPLASTDARHT